MKNRNLYMLLTIVFGGMRNSHHPVVFMSLAFGVLFCSFANASLIDLTGADLLSNPNVSFPNETPTLSGTSLVYGPTVQPYGKMLEILLFPAGSLPPSGAISIEVKANMTRLGCISPSVAGACNQNGGDDWDPQIMLSDGANMVGGLFANNNNGSGLFAEMMDAGNFGVNRITSPLFQNASYPSVGSAVDFNLFFLLTTAGTIVELSFLGGSGQFAASTVLDRSSDLSLVFVRDDNLGEQYQINTVGIPTIPEPATCLSLLLGGSLLCRRRAVSCVSPRLVGVFWPSNPSPPKPLMPARMESNFLSVISRDEDRHERADEHDGRTRHRGVGGGGVA